MPDTPPPIDPRRVQAALETVRAELPARRTPDGHWTGRLSASALATATAVSALAVFRGADRAEPLAPEECDRFDRLLRRGVDWLSAHQNPDGGWGDTDKSFSNIATTLLVKSALVLAGSASKDDLSADERNRNCLTGAGDYLRRFGGIDAVRRRYGSDLTFSVPILTNAALAGLVPWSDVPQLPFERAALPRVLFRLLKLNVVSYAIPALVAIGQVRFHHRPEWNKPVRAFLRRLAVRPTLRLIDEMQPASGGFLEAAPLTAFVAMSLIARGLPDHPVVLRGLRFLADTVREDGSWPIDTNLATWTTSLSVAALGREFFENSRDDSEVGQLVDWILSCQHRRRHPYTGAEPGGWGWTDLSGAVPDGDDTPGALLALAELWPTLQSLQKRDDVREAAEQGIAWLLKLQNRDGGIPTFCRGWGLLPFDRSSTDLTAHALRAVLAWRPILATFVANDRLRVPLLKAMTCSVRAMISFLVRRQNPDGSWYPLWFGNQHRPDDVNPCYGTAKVLRALLEIDALRPEGVADVRDAIRRGRDWIVAHQNPDGGWGGDGTASGVEETAATLETAAMLQTDSGAATSAYRRGLRWLVEAVESGRWTEASPIGLYFAKLWYYEDLYPIVFSAAALRRAGPGQ